MAQAHYKILEDGTLYGEIPVLRGVLANSTTLDACQAELQDVLEEWIVLGLRLGHTFRSFGGVEIPPLNKGPDAHLS